MGTDFLHDPLGGTVKPTSRTTPWRIGSIAAICAIVLAGATALVFERSRSPAQPAGAVVASIGPAVSPPLLPAIPPPAAAKTVQSADDVETSSGVSVVRPPGAPTVGAQILQVPQDMTVSLQHAPDLALVEKTRWGLLPQRGPDGARPADVYARPVVTDGSLPANAPRVALLVGGMGLNAALTTSAAESLPPDVSFGFAPYGDNLDAQVAATRNAGHEAVLQLPMEGFGDPASTTMSHLLTTDLSGKELLERLHWLMGRFTGYAGVANFLGERFTADETALAPVLRDVAGRGLFFVDDGSSARSLVPTLAPAAGLPLAHADVSLDGAKDAPSFDAAMDRLIQRARDGGCAVGIASGLPATITRLVAFGRTAAQRGVLLVPISACVGTGGRTMHDVVAQP